MKIRRSSKDDIPGIKRVLENSAQSEFALAPLNAEQDDLTDVDLDIAALEIEMEIFDNIRAISVLADDGGEVVAYARCWLNSMADGTGKISHVGVLEDRQGKGIGTELMKYLIGLSREHQHIKRLELEVAQDNRAAVKVYERLGFRSKPPETSRQTITGPRMHIRMFREVEPPEFPVEPPWIRYKDQGPTWSGWRQGDSEGWLLNSWLPMWRGLNADQRRHYLDAWPPPDADWAQAVNQWGSP